jgi:hypothetical protein
MTPPISRGERICVTQNCADCGGPIGKDNGPPDGWQLEDGRTVCHSCCCADLKKFVDHVIRARK